MAGLEPVPPVSTPGLQAGSRCKAGSSRQVDPLSQGYSAPTKRLKVYMGKACRHQADADLQKLVDEGTDQTSGKGPQK